MLHQNYKRDVRLSATLLTSTFYTELSTISSELNDLRKQRRLDEKKLRNRIIDDYDDLVHELVSEINVLRARFSEHRISTAQEVMEILSEVKKETLLTVAENRELPEEMRRAAVEGGRREESLDEWREDNHELRMVVSFEIIRKLDMHNFSTSAVATQITFNVQPKRTWHALHCRQANPEIHRRK